MSREAKRAKSTVKKIKEKLKDLSDAYSGAIEKRALIKSNFSGASTKSISKYGFVE